MLRNAFDGIEIAEATTQQAAFEWILSQPIAKPASDESLHIAPIDLGLSDGSGLRTGEAARVLGLTPHTVAGYMKIVYRKLNTSSRAEAAVEAVRRGLV